jgi:glycosyltransferase involved in cell wall biosynthesis
VKVLVFTQYFWPENFHINSVVENLRDKGIEVTVLTGKPNYPEGEFPPGYSAWGIKREDFRGIPVVRIPMLARGQGSAVSLFLNYLSFVFSGIVFAPQALKQHAFDIVFVYAPSPILQALPAIYFAKRSQIPLVVWVQDLWPDVLRATGRVSNPWLLRKVDSVVRYIYRHADGILIQSEGFRSSIASKITDESRIHFLPNSARDPLVEPSVPSPWDALAKSIADSFSVVFTGNIGAAQSCETIVEAAQLLRNELDIKFFLIGTGSAVDVIGRKIRELRLDNVVLTGPLPPQAMPSVMAAASTLLLTLRADPFVSETIPSKLQSYLASKKPILVCAEGMPARIVEIARAGKVCKADDGIGLARSVLSMRNTPMVERNAYGVNARAYFDQHFSMEQQSQTLIAILTRLVDMHAKNER